MVLQGLLVEFGRNAFHCSKGGLTIQQWGVCFLMSSLTFIVSFFCKFIPVPECKDKEFDEEKEIIINVDNEEKKLLSDEE